MPNSTKTKGPLCISIWVIINEVILLQKSATWDYEDPKAMRCLMPMYWRAESFLWNYWEFTYYGCFSMVLYF